MPSHHVHSMALPPSSRSSRVPSPPPRSMEANQHKNEPIPLYFAWNRLDPSYKDEEHGKSKNNSSYRGEEARPPPQCRLDESEKEVASKLATRTASSSHHFLVDPNLDDDDSEPFVTEYADKYRAWTIPVKNHTNAKKNKGQRQDERGVELALRGMGISPTPQTRIQEPTIVPSINSIGFSRDQPRVVAESETVRPSPTSLAVGTDAPVVITCDNRTAKTSEMDEQSCLTGTTAPSTPTGSASSFRCGSGLAK